MATEKRLIEANRLVEWLIRAGRYLKGIENSKPITKAIGKIIDHVQEMPTVDAVEVVRCKECRYCQHDANGFWCFNDYEHNLQPDDFCSYGERRNK